MLSSFCHICGQEGTKDLRNEKEKHFSDAQQFLLLPQH